MKSCLMFLHSKCFLPQILRVELYSLDHSGPFVAKEHHGVLAVVTVVRYYLSSD